MKANTHGGAAVVSHAVPEVGGHPHGNLPPRLTSLVGRGRELEEIAAELARTRLLTLTGAGGCGKTTLARETAARVAADYPDGVWWVELGPVADGSELGAALTVALGVRPRPDQTELDAATAYLAGRHALVVLDNCEHLLEDCARVAEALVASSERVSVLATSRASLGALAETDWRVPSMALPEAIQLFAERAAKVRPGFGFSVDDAESVADVCSKLDGMPLAIELAAGRLRVLSVREIADALSDALGVVRGGARSALPRHRTLRASIEWSYELLGDRHQLLLRRLGVFTGGFTLSLATAVCSDQVLPPEDVLDVLATLIEHSLVQVVADGDGATRYRLLETVRQFAVEQLESTGELRAMRDRHRDGLLDYAEHQRELILSPRQPEAYEALEREAPNLLAAIDHAIDTDPEVAQRLAVALAFWFRHTGRLREGIQATQDALDAGDSAHSSLRANALAGLAFIVRDIGDFERAWSLANDALEIAEELGDDDAAGYALGVIAELVVFVDPANARPTIERGMEFGQRTGNDWLVARAAMMHACLNWFQQTHRPGDDPFAKHWDVIVRLGDRETLSYSHFVLGGACYPTLEHERARKLFARAIEVAGEIRHPLCLEAPRAMTATVDAGAGRAEDALQSALAIRERLLLRGGVFYLAWIEVTIAICEAGIERLDDAAARLRSVVAETPGEPAPAMAWAAAILAEVCRLQGDAGAAHDHANRGLEVARDLGNPWNVAQAQLVLSRLAAGREDFTLADELGHAALAAVVDCGLDLELPGCLEALARVAAGVESHDEAARILGAAARIRRERGPVAWPAQQAETDALAAAVRDALGPDAFARAFAEGTGLTTEEAVAWVRRARGQRKRPSAGWESLTPTEVEVARHVAAGLTNPQIAERMFISRSTVKTHLAHAYAKLNVANRVELARLAAEREAADDIAHVREYGASG